MGTREDGMSWSLSTTILLVASSGGFVDGCLDGKTRGLCAFL